MGAKQRVLPGNNHDIIYSKRRNVTGLVVYLPMHRKEPGQTRSVLERRQKSKFIVDVSILFRQIDVATVASLGIGKGDLMLFEQRRGPKQSHVAGFERVKSFHV